MAEFSFIFVFCQFLDRGDAVLEFLCKYCNVHSLTCSCWSPYYLTLQAPCPVLVAVGRLQEGAIIHMDGDVTKY